MYETSQNQNNRVALERSEETPYLRKNRFPLHLPSGGPRRLGAGEGVTYCGESAASSLTMANVPWHEEVVRFVRELVDLLPDYEVACEHEHSNCLLIGHKKFKIDGEWWTWINYSRFQELVLQYEESGGSKTFSSRDYMARTPQWALFGARERGFDPKDTRYQRKNKTKDISGC